MFKEEFEKLKIIANKYSVNLYQVSLTDECWKYHVNSSYIENYKDIYLGLYFDKELWTMSFFHELGHAVADVKTLNMIKYDVEQLAWEKGLEIAEEHGYKFSFKAYKWASECLDSYFEYEDRKDFDSIANKQNRFSNNSERINELKLCLEEVLKIMNNEDANTSVNKNKIIIEDVLARYARGKKLLTIEDMNVERLLSISNNDKNNKFTWVDIGHGDWEDE